MALFKDIEVKYSSFIKEGEVGNEHVPIRKKTTEEVIITILFEIAELKFQIKKLAEVKETKKN